MVFNHQMYVGIQKKERKMLETKRNHEIDKIIRKEGFPNFFFLFETFFTFSLNGLRIAKMKIYIF